MKGKVYLVGAGPGDPELLTLKAFRVLQRADVVLHDELVSQEILALVPVRAQVWNVGKRWGQKKTTQEEINALLLAYANIGRRVVRLKGGDPLIFGRAAEEIEALRGAGIDFEIVPGITAAVAAAAAAQIPLTDRRWSSKLVLMTGHPSAGKSASDWRSAAATGATLAVYMPGSCYTDLAQALRSAGWDAATPCVFVSCASTPQEQIRCTTIDRLSQAPQLPAPAILLVGRVAAPHAGKDSPEGSSDSACAVSREELPKACFGGRR